MTFKNGTLDMVNITLKMVTRLNSDGVIYPSHEKTFPGNVIANAAQTFFDIL
jgi:hypothetical protein